ncbi:DNRLRE domain-containing protein, partial [Cellulomonas bogoriensis]|uniref:DNRLRE domain-containing protein n=1 Tax=Cellulomonas bogoriensis TaxID=301388 RepID=UPI0018DB3140
MSVLIGFVGMPGRWRGRALFVAAVTGVTVGVTGLSPVTPAVAAPEEPPSPEVVTPTGDLTAPDAFSASANARITGQRVEDLSQRTEHESVYALPDGSWQAAISTGPVWVRQGGDGTAVEDWAPADATLKRAGEQFKPVAHVGDLTISGGGTAQDGAVVVAALTDPGTGVTNELTWPGDLPEPQVVGPRATYRDVQPGIDMVLEVTGTGVEQFFVVKERPSAEAGAGLALPVGLVSDGADAQADAAGAVDMVTPEGQTVAKVAAPQMWDADHDALLVAPLAADWDGRGVPELWANGLTVPGGDDADAEAGGQDGDPEGVGRSAPVPTEVEVVDGDAEMVLTPGEDFLLDPQTVFPVVVDPSVNLTMSFDTFVQSDHTWDNSTATDLRIGTHNGGSARARSFLTVGTSAIKGKHVTSAELRLYQYHSWSCTAREWQVWQTGTASTSTRWGSQPSWTKRWHTSTDTRGYSSSCSAGWSSVGITSLAREWAGASGTTHGVGLRAASETDNFGWKRFNSGNASSGKPTIVVNYNSYPGTPSSAEIASGHFQWYPSSSDPDRVLYVKSTKPTFSAVVSDPDGGNVRARFDILSGSTLVWDKLSGTSVASGSRSTFKPTSSTPALVEGRTYSARVWGYDGSLHSEKSRAMPTFIVDTTAPAVPTVTASAYTDGQWYDPAPASNTFTFNASSTDVVKFEYSQDGGAWKSLTANTSRRATLSWAPKSGAHSLRVRAVDKAGWASSIRTFTFGTGGPTLGGPATGLKSTDRFNVVATAPTAGAGTVTPTIYFRPSGGTDPDDFSGTLGSTSGWTQGPTLASVPTGQAVSVNHAWSAAAAAQELGQDRVPLLLDVQVCFAYTSPAVTRCTWTADPASQVTVVRVPHAFGAAFPVADAGLGQVALWTGEFNTSVTDVSVPGYVGDLSVSRSYSSLAGMDEGSVFGPGWRASFDGTDIGVAGWEVIDNTRVDGTIVLLDEEGDVLIFKQPGTSRTHLRTGTYTAADAETAEYGARLTVSGSAMSTVVTFTEDDGTVTRFTPVAFTAGKTTQFLPSAVVEPGSAGETTFTRDAQQRITRILAPVPPGVTCPASGTLNPGCRAVHVTYGSSTTATAAQPGDVAGQVKEIAYEAFDPKKAGMSRVVVAQYRYSAAKHLVEVKDPRTGLVASYAYEGTSTSGQPLLVQATPPGLAPFHLVYGAASVDAKALTRVERTAPAGGGGRVRLGTFVYGLDPSASGALPSFARASAWGQDDAPVYGAAVFGADRPGVAGSGPGDVTSADWPFASLQYTDGQGRVTNTAVFGAGEWQLTATRYDEAGRVVHELDTGAMAQIRSASEDLSAAEIDSYATITRYNADILADKAITTDAGTIAAGTVLTPAGTLVTDTWAPTTEVTRPDGSVELVRLHTHTRYDEGAPNNGVNPKTGLAFRLPTTVTVTEADPLTGSSDLEVAVPAGEKVVSTSSTGYAPIDSAGVLDATSGWVLGSATTTTVVNGSQQIVTRTRYDAEGKVVESRQPASTGGDAGTTVTAYYTTAAQSGATAVCGGKPQWAGLVCRTARAESTATVPVEVTGEYSMYLAPAVVTETLGSAVRTTTTSFDAAGRTVESATSVTGVAGSTPVPAARTEYDPSTGAVVATVAVGSGGQVMGRVRQGYDAWGRAVTYTDTDGRVTTTSYDAAGRVASVTDPTGTLTSTYDGEGERRGLVTSQTLTGVGTFRA